MVVPWSNRLISKLFNDKHKNWDRYWYSKTSESYDQHERNLQVFDDEKYRAVRRYENYVISNKNGKPKKVYNYFSKKDKYASHNLILRCNEKIETDEKKMPRKPEITEVTINNYVTEKIISDLDDIKSTGPDGIPAIIIKKF